MSEDELIGIAEDQESAIPMTTSQQVEEFMVLDAMAKMLASQARALKQNIQDSIVGSEDELTGMSVGDFELRIKPQSVDWNADIIQTITTIDGVSEQDKSELFHPPVKKANGVKLNSIKVKYGGTVAKRIEQAREERGVSLTISTNRVIQDKIAKEAIKRLKGENHE